MPAVEVTWHSRGEIPGLSPAPGSALIEIVNPGWSAIGESSRWGAYLGLEFWDEDDVHLPGMKRVIADRLGGNAALCLAVGRWLFGDGGGWVWRPFLAADAVRVRALARQVKDRSISRIHVACEYGRSRSRAVAEWLAGECGTVATGNRKGRPNARVVRLLNEKAC